MVTPSYFRTITGKKLPVPVFFPDATQAVIRTLDSSDVENTKTLGVLVNTYHLYRNLGKEVLKRHGGIRGFMKWEGGVISDSGGFQVMTLAKNNSKRGKITDLGVTFHPQGSPKLFLSPEMSIAFQMILKTDMVVVLDDFTDINANYDQARESVERTILWAKKSKEEFDKQCKALKLSKSHRPYLLAVVQGGEYLDLRKECTLRLAEMGFDGFGYGGWPMDKEGNFNFAVAQTIADNAPDGSFLYGLGVGKPHEIVRCAQMGYTIFDCVLPTRDARHKRLYVFNAPSVEEIDLTEEKFYSYYSPNKESHYKDDSPVSAACDCLLCQRYSRAYLAHLFRVKEMTALRLATIHNLRFYSMLMEKLSQK